MDAGAPAPKIEAEIAVCPITVAIHSIHVPKGKSKTLRAKLRNLGEKLR